MAIKTERDLINQGEDVCHVCTNGSLVYSSSLYINDFRHPAVSVLDSPAGATLICMDTPAGSFSGFIPDEFSLFSLFQTPVGLRGHMGIRIS